MTEVAAQNLVFLVLVAFGVVGAIALRRPVQRRFAVRNVVRRRGEASLVIGGSLLGAALITGSFIVGDTLEASQRATAATQLGPVDEMMVVHERSDAKRLQSLIESLDDPRIDGVTTIVTADAAIVSGAGESTKAEPRARLIEADFEDIRSFGGDPAATGLSGTTPRPGTVVLGADLADNLAVRPGDSVAAHLYGKSIDLEVTRIVPRRGIAGLEWQGTNVTSLNAFVARRTLESVADPASLEPGVLPPHARVLVSNRGDVESGSRLSEEVAQAIRKALPPEARGLDMELLKADRLEAARTSGQYFGGMFVAIGSFAVIAGILLLVSIFVMLAEERKGQLGMLRAVGMKRGDLVKGFVIEGAMYALAASAVGAMVGIAIGRGIIALATPLLADGEETFTLAFSPRPASVVGGFCLGAVISLMTIVFTSLRISRLNVIRAIRDLPEPKGARVRLRSVVLGGACAAAAIAALLRALATESGWPVVIVGPVIAALGLRPLAARLVGGRRASVGVFTFTLAWGIFGNTITDGRFFASDSMAAYVFQGVVITFSAVALLSLVQELIQRATRRFASGRLAVRLATAYPIASRLRTSLTLGMYALVMFTLVFVASLAGTLGDALDDMTAKVSAGFDVVANASGANPPAESDVADVAGRERVVTALGGYALFDRSGKDPQQWAVTGIDAGFVGTDVPRLKSRDPAYASDAEAWETVATTEDGIILSPFFLHVGGDMASVPEPGDTVTTVDPTTGHEHGFRVAGVLESDPTFMGAVVSKQALAVAAPTTVSASRFYLDLEGSGDQAAQALANDLESSFVENGMEAKTIRSIVEEQQQSTVQFLALMQAFLGLGLVVGVAGLGVVMVRAVRERRHEIGVLRSLGFVARRIRHAFLWEAGLVAFEGVVIGATLALITAYQGVRAGDFGEGTSFRAPWDQVGLLVVVALVASLAATAWPARQASRVAPAIALRVSD